MENSDPCIYRWFFLGILASNNNCATMDLDIFEDITDEFGLPSCTQGDHGTENLLVAALMEDVHGVGSYIWGKFIFSEAC